MTLAERFNALLDATGVIAILRGLTTDAAVAVVAALEDAGVRIVEVPLNSPDPFATIRLLRDTFRDRMIVGAGTVTTVEQVDRLAQAGGQLCVAPNVDPAVIGSALAHAMLPIPGFATPTEAFAALAAGARYLKVFPASETIGMLRALNAVLPAHARLIGVGGVEPGTMRGLREAGCIAFGLGSEIFKPGREVAEIGSRAIRSLRAASASSTPEARLLADTRCQVGESATWLEDRQTLYWIDAGSSVLHSYCPVNGATHRVALARQLFGLAATSNQMLIGATERGLCSVDAATGVQSEVTPIDVPSGCRLNDIAVDGQDRVWAGAMHRGLLSGQGTLHRSTAGGGSPVTLAASGLGVPNGIGFSPDFGLLYLIDTRSRHLLAYPIAGDALGEPAIVTDFLGVPGKPDGLGVAADGRIWVAMWGGGLVVCIDADGSLVRSVPVAAPNVSSVVSGPNCLFVTTSRFRVSEEQLLAAPASGGLFAIPLF